jgi:cephalosporin-C deacetylase-like acetyl esterase
LKNIDFTKLPSPIGRYRDIVRETCGVELPDLVTGWYKAIALQQGAEREAERRAIVDPAAWQQERDGLKKAYQEALGSFPPHAVEVVEKGVIEKPGVLIRKILFSAATDNWVPANIYVPRKAEAPFPAVVSPCGHGIGGKAAYAKRATQLAHNGYAVITFDFIGTGERQLLHHHQALCPVSTQHNLLGAKLPLAGCTLGWFMLQETLAAVTVLQRQPEVDPERIGITGSSGGGWTSVHAAALDPRIKVVIPAASVCSFRHAVQADDAEQVLFGMQRRGLHYADFLSFLICPRPLFIVANSHDIWGLDGTRNSFNEAHRFYAMAGAADRLTMQVWDKGHAYEDDQLAVAIGWFNTWLKGKPDDPVTLDIPLADLPQFDELLVSPQENIFADGSPRPNAVFAKYERERPSGPSDPAAFLETLKQTVRSGSGAPVWRELDRFVPGTGSGRRICFSPAPGLLLPAEILIPDVARGITILVDEGDRRDDLDWQMRLMQEGEIVVRPDLRGWGETQPREDWADWEGWAQNRYSDRRYHLYALARLTGRNLVLDRAQDLIALVDGAASQFPGKRIALWGRRQGALAALYAALAEKRIVKLTLERYPRSYRDLMASDLPLWTNEGNVEKILCNSLDIPELLQAYTGELILKEPMDGSMRPV